MKATEQYFPGVLFIHDAIQGVSRRMKSESVTIQTGATALSEAA